MCFDQPLGGELAAVVWLTWHRVNEESDLPPALEHEPKRALEDAFPRLELKSGKVVWEKRLRGPANPSDSWSSMVLAKDRIYVVNKGGDTFALKASPTFELLATNSLFETPGCGGPLGRAGFSSDV